MAGNGLAGVRPNGAPSDDDAMGMLARKQKELADNARAIAGTGVGAGGGEDPGAAHDKQMYQDIGGKWHCKGCME